MIQTRYTDKLLDGSREPGVPLPSKDSGICVFNLLTVLQIYSYIKL